MKLLKKIALMAIAIFASVAALVSCGNNTEALEAAAKRLLITQDKQEVTGNFEVTSIVKSEGVSYEVTWSSNHEVAKVGEKDGNFYPIIVDYENNKEAVVTVTLTATISDGKNSVTKDFTIIVPIMVEYSVADYDAAPAGEQVSVKGIIVAKEEFSASYKNTSVYLQSMDGKGGIYAYRVKCTEEQYNNELVVGNVIIVSGKKDVYNGLREFSTSADVTYILCNQTGTPKVTDVTELITSGTGISNDLQCQLIKFENLPVVNVEAKDDKGRWNIIVGDATDKAKQFVVRVNTYITQTTSDAYKAYEALGIAPGMTISAAGVCGWYNGAQMHPINVNDITVAQNAEGNVAYELGGVVFDEKYDACEITLPVATKYTDVELAYEVVAGAENATIADGKLTLTASAQNVTVTIKVTATLGDIVLTKNVDLIVKGTEVVEVYTSIADAIALGTAQEHNKYTSDKYYIQAIVKEVQNTTYGNILVTDGTNDILVYGSYSADGQNRYDAMEVKPQVGDTIVVYGVLGRYNETPQMKNGWIIVAFEGAAAPETPEEPETPEVPETPAVTLKENTAYTISGNNSVGLVYFAGTVSSGRFNGTYNASEATKVYVEISEGTYKVYFFNSSNEKQYLVVGDSSTGGSLTADSSAATVFEWSELRGTLVVAEDSNNRALAFDPTKDFTTFSCYDSSQANYNYGIYTEVEGSTPETPETPEVPETPETPEVT